MTTTLLATMLRTTFLYAMRLEPRPNVSVMTHFTTDYRMSCSLHIYYNSLCLPTPLSGEWPSCLLTCLEIGFERGLCGRRWAAWLSKLSSAQSDLTAATKTLSLSMLLSYVCADLRPLQVPTARNVVRSQRYAQPCGRSHYP